ncbi:peptidase S74, partial [Bacillus cereus group sp. N6]|nr:peptidase S74 [Bacillus cereus group sp. N6]
IVDPNEEVRKIYNRILRSLGNKQEMIDQLDKLVKDANDTASHAKKESEAAKALTKKVQQNLKNYQTEIIKAKNAPTTGLETNKTLWLDMSKTPYLLYLWNGTEWIRMGIDTPTEIGAVTKVEFEKRTESIEQSVEKVERKQTEQGEQLQQAKASWETTANALKGKVEIKQVEDYVAKFQIPDLRATVKQNKEDLLEQLAEKVATEPYNQKITDLQRMIQANKEGIEIRALSKEVYTRKEADGNFATDAYVKEMGSKLQVLDEGILAEVKKGNLISVINQTAERIKIKAEMIDLVGKVKTNWIQSG